jgi:hypothetical protein
MAKINPEKAPILPCQPIRIEDRNKKAPETPPGPSAINPFKMSTYKNRTSKSFIMNHLQKAHNRGTSLNHLNRTLTQKNRKGRAYCVVNSASTAGS